MASSFSPVAVKGAQHQISYESAEALMEHGSHALYGHIATKLETALGRSLPQMEVHFSNLSISADIVVFEDDSPKSELPTLLNSVKKGLSGFNKKKEVAHKEILKNVSGVFKPGKITLILGQPGSGKSSLMKLLSGQFPIEKNITIEGDITYNGVRQQELTKRLPQFVTYVRQRDVHFPSLAAKETLEFAHTFCGGELARRGEELLSKGTPEENIEALEAAKAMFAHYPDIIVRQLGLENCQDTIVGNMLRGVSGGERKRVTTGEMEFGMKYMTLMDEISTGLDSAATYDIICTQRSITKTFHKTVVIALLQLAPEVFALFDEVMILNEGEVMHHGPREQVVDYFHGLGFVCPPQRDAADFLLDLGTNQQHRYQAALPAMNGEHPRLPSEFTAIFRRSSIHSDMLQALNAPHSPELLANVEAHMDPMPEFHQSFWDNTWVLVRRQLMITLRNTAFIKGRCIMVILMALICASALYQLNPENVQVVLGIVFQGALFLSLGQASQIPTFTFARDIFYKQRAANFYRASSYVLACSVSQLPLALFESVVFGTLVYWMCGLAAAAEAHFVYTVMLVLTNLSFAACFFRIAAVSPNLHIAKPISMVAIVFFVLFAGFLMTKSQISDYFVWIYWVNPIAWCLRAVAVNQYRSSKFDKYEHGGINYCERFGKRMGQYLLGLFDIPDPKSWIWYSMLFMAASYVFFMSLAYLVLEYKRYESPEHISVKPKAVDEEETYDLMAIPKSASLGASSTSEELVLNVTTREKNFVPATLAFKDLWYTAPLPINPKHETIDLLKGITGYTLPGTMTALMGSSGAGKTTLMDVIAGRKTAGTIQGQILLNGYEATDLSIRCSTGYCEQMDIHLEASTIREALTFSAFLRQESSVPDRQKFDTVNECLDLLDTHGIADQIVRGSSVEQIKRLTIGVELAAQPSVLFLDEPTSGLDARSAKLIMDGVRKVANTGRTIVRTIHQPSSEVFFLFDHLLLLKRGGETVFFDDLGKNSRNLTSYFEAISGVAPLPRGYNPATWMLGCIGTGVGHVPAIETDFVQCFNASECKRQLDTEISKDGVGRPAADTSKLLFTEKRAASSVTQMRALVKRFFDLYWRTSSYNLTRLVISLCTGLLFGVVFVNAECTSYQGINSGTGMALTTTLFNGVVSFNSVLPISSEERASFYYERASQTYNAFWYFVGSTVAEIPYTFASGLLFTVVFFPMVGFTGFAHGVLFWVTTSLTILLSTYMGQFLAYALPSVEVAAIIGVLVNNIFFTFMGFNPPANKIPPGYKWLHDITPRCFPLAILSALVFADCDEPSAWNEALQVYEGMARSLAATL